MKRFCFSALTYLAVALLGQLSVRSDEFKTGGIFFPELNALKYIPEAGAARTSDNKWSFMAITESVEVCDIPEGVQTPFLSVNGAVKFRLRKFRSGAGLTGPSTKSSGCKLKIGWERVRVGIANLSVAPT